METADLVVDGTRTSGKDIREQNVTAAAAIANIVKSSLGPVGLDKMLVDDIGDVTITNDGATILKQLEVEQPAGKVLVELAGLQDQEVGDGTTSVVIIAAELLKVSVNIFFPSNSINEVFTCVLYVCVSCCSVPMIWSIIRSTQLLSLLDIVSLCVKLSSTLKRI